MAPVQFSPVHPDLHPTKSGLSPNRRRLVALLQAVNFGRIESLHVRGGEPVFDPKPRVVREVKFGGDNGPRRELDCVDFALKAQVLELLAHCAALGTGVIECLVVKHGLPFSMSLEDAA